MLRKGLRTADLGSNCRLSTEAEGQIYHIYSTRARYIETIWFRASIHTYLYNACTYKLKISLNVLGRNHTITPKINEGLQTRTRNSITHTFLSTAAQSPI